jgi:uracil-DNA glycosylase family 4
MKHDPNWENLEKQIISCRLCPRLVGWREQIAIQRRRTYQEWDYWGKPVPGFGDHQGQILVVGLAPGAHGSNRTGRMFTGDASGIFLYRALYRANFASQPESCHPGDGLILRNMYISAICRCVPPKNKPNPKEITNCLPFLHQEIQLLENLRVIVVLGRIAFRGIINLFDLKMNLDFQHGAVYKLSENLPWMVVSYHPSQQNTQTGRLTEGMFDRVWSLVRNKI